MKKDNELFNILFMISALIVGTLIAASLADAAPLTRAEANMLTLDKCLHPDSIEVRWDKFDAFPLIQACQMEHRRAKDEGRRIRKIIIKSNCRWDNPRSRHYNCLAIDFHYVYSGNKCRIWTDYRQDSTDLYDWFFFHGWDEEIGQGVYQNLTHHLHADGERDLWGFDDNKVQVTYQHAMNLVEEKIEKFCN